MSREIDLSQPLSAEDVAWLQDRHPVGYVNRMIELAGGAEEPVEAPEEAEGENPEAEGSEAGSGEGEDAEDLIGDFFDPGKHTVDEVTAYLAGASDEERQRVLAVEADGKGRAGILNG